MLRRCFTFILTLLCSLLLSVSVFAAPLPLVDSVFEKPDFSSTFPVQFFIRHAGNGNTYACITLPVGISYIGTIFPDENDYLISFNYMANAKDGVVSSWKYPFYLDTLDNEPYYALYTLKIHKGKIILKPIYKELSLAHYGYDDIDGTYMWSFDAKPGCPFPLAAYVIQTSDPFLVKNMLLPQDIHEWWFDKLEAGNDSMIGQHPVCHWAVPTDADDKVIGNYLLFEDLTHLYKDNQKIF